MKKNQGCLITGAYGDALGWPVEFMSLEAIKKKYGDKGIQDLDAGLFSKAQITDDTQMTLFTAEGLLAAFTANGREVELIPEKVAQHVHKAYLRWYKTQTGDERVGLGLLKYPELWNRRAPGGTCLSALDSGECGTMDNPINHSKGCGGVMRAAPVGLLYGTNKAFEMGCVVAAITHGHPSGYLSAGVLAHIIASIQEGNSLVKATLNALKVLETYQGHQECLQILELARTLANENASPEKAFRILGQGWVGEEALAISLFFCLRFQDLSIKDIIALAVNHDGDSDSTGAIAGNILGALENQKGSKETERFKKDLELGSVIVRVEKDLNAAKLGMTYSDPSWDSKYKI